MMIKIVKKGRGWFQTYEENPTATNLSMAGGGARLLSILLLIAAIPCTVAVLMAVARVSMVGSVGTALIFLMDEMDDLLLAAFFLWSGVAVCRYATCVLQSKAALYAQNKDEEAKLEPTE